MDERDGRVLMHALQEQSTTRKVFPLDPAEQRILRQRPVITPKGPVDVEIPPADEHEDRETARQTPAKPNDEGVRESIAVQATLAAIGAKMGYSVWIPANDRAGVRSQLAPGDAAKLLEPLPLNHEDNTLRTVEQIDVIWLRNRSIVRAFEVEHTTAVYSGLLRMADLISLQPNIDIRLHIVADEAKREKVFRELSRPVFRLLENGALSESCSYLSYGSVRQINALPHLGRMTDKIIDDF
jgi:hypothetical protein